MELTEAGVCAEACGAPLNASGKHRAPTARAAASLPRTKRCMFFCSRTTRWIAEDVRLPTLRFVEVCVNAAISANKSASR